MGDLTDRWPARHIDSGTANAIAAAAPVLAATEIDAENDRRLPDAAFEALAATGLFEASLPRELGGAEIDPLAEFEVYEAVARASMPACWNLFIGALHTSFPAAYVSDEAAATMFVPGHRTIAAGQFQPVGVATRVDGGMTVTGAYRWGSGMAHATWVLGSAVFGDTGDGDTGDGDTVIGWTAPKDQATVEDNWFVMGNAGSGSVDYRVTDLFVPDGFWFDMPRPPKRRGGHRFDAPIPAQIAPSHMAVALGSAERALALIAAGAHTKKRMMLPGFLANREVFQKDLAVLFCRLDAARELALSRVARLSEAHRSGREVTPGLVAELYAVTAFVTETAVDVAAAAYRYGGGDAARLDHPLQRILRDLLVIQQHVFVAENRYVPFGAQLLSEAHP